MPAYNAEKYIEESIRSMLNQSFTDWELIIVNDGSVDRTHDIIASFSDERIQSIYQENAGVSRARNVGLEKAFGKYITFLDADDILPLNSLEARVDYLELHPDIDVVDGQVVVKDQEMINEIRIYQPYYVGELLPRLVALDDRVFFNVCYLFRSNILNGVHFKENMTHAEDLLFYIEISSRSEMRYGHVSNIIYLYRSGHESAMGDLEGLQNGYKTLLKRVGLIDQISLMQKLKMRIKLMKIMFLCWMKKGEYRKAVESVSVFF